VVRGGAMNAGGYRDVDSRCPRCLWAGTVDGVTCPNCGYGVVAFELELDTDD